MSTMFALDYVTTEEAANIIGVTPGRVRQLRRANKIQFVQVDSRTFLIPRSEAERLSERRPGPGRPRTADRNPEE